MASNGNMKSSNIKTSITVDESLLKRIKEMKIEASYLKFPVDSYADALDLLLKVWELGKENGTVDRYRQGLTRKQKPR